MGCCGGRSHIPFPYPMPSGPAPMERPQSAKDILRMRLAQGEITVEEYQQMLSALEGEDSRTPQKRKSHIRMP